MEQFLDIIVDIEVTDKRQTGGVSTNMEVYTLKRLLERIVGKLLVTEIVTGASAAVMKLVRDMKVNFSRIYLTTSNKFPLPNFTKKFSQGDRNLEGGANFLAHPVCCTMPIT